MAGALLHPPWPFRGNLTVSNAKRPDKTGLAGAITHASVLYDQIVHRLSSFLHL